MAVVALLVECFLLLAEGAAQTIQVDITPAHSTNRFVPNETLGAGVDRIPASSDRQGSAPAHSGQGVCFGLAAGDLSPEYRACDGGVALESAMERGAIPAARATSRARPLRRSRFATPTDIRCRIAGPRATTAPGTRVSRGSPMAT